MTEQLTGPDPFLRQTPLDLQCVYYPLGFPLHLKTNSPQLLWATSGAGADGRKLSIRRIWSCTRLWNRTGNILPNQSIVGKGI